MKKLIFIGAMLLSACVTINIYFPAAAAEKAADQIIKGIQENTPAKKPEPKAQLSDWQLAVYQGIEIALNQLVSPVQAAEADLDIDSEEIRKLQAGMKSRFNSLVNFYSKGFIGIKRDGLIAIKDASNIPLKDRNEANKLVSAENNDRDALYRAIANANGHPEWYEQIKSTFAERWISNAKDGWWYEVSNNNWKQK
jgi:uncharacterized protein YdbL (DUF1318 family)